MLDEVTKAIEEGILKKDLLSVWCTVCKANMQFISAESHLQGARHKKALKNFQLQEASKQGASCDTAGSSGTGLLAAISKGQVVSRNIGNNVLLTCVPCNECYGEEIPMIQHLATEVHAQNIEREALNPSVSPPRVPSNTPPPSGGLTIQSSGVSSSGMLPVQDVFEAIRSGMVIQATTNGLVTLTCSLCQKQCNGEVTMRQHLTSLAHATQLKKKEQRLRLSSARESSVSTVTPSTTRQFDSALPATTSTVQGNGMAQAMANPADPDENPFYCTLCKIPCSGKESKEQHLKGKNHTRRLAMEEMQNLSLSPAREPLVTTVTTCTTRQFDSASPATTSTMQGNGVAQAKDTIIVIPPEPDENYLYCPVCDIPCTGKESMEQHLKGKSHFKKLKMKEQRQNLSPAQELSVATVTPSTTTTREFDSAVPAATSTVQGNGMAQAMSNTADPAENSHYCSVCEIPCTGKESMDQHLSGKSHKRRLIMKEQRQSLSPAREPLVANVTPSTSTTRQFDSASPATTSTVQGNGVAQAMDKTIEVAAEADVYSLKCSVCGITCTGREQLMEHRKGRSHMKKLKERNHGELQDNFEDSPGSPIRIDCIQHEESIRELTKDIRIYKPTESLSDMFDEVIAG